MDNITISAKPESISYDEICSVLDEIHQTEQFHYNTSGMNGLQLEQHLRGGGICFVALDGNNVIGTISICIEKINRWYYHGIVGRIRFMGVLPEYRGKKLGTRLIEAGLSYARENAIDAVIFATADVNRKAIAMYQKVGCQYVDFMHYQGLGHYSVVGIYWLKKPVHSGLTCRLRFFLKKCYVKSRYTPNGEKRFV